DRPALSAAFARQRFAPLRKHLKGVKRLFVVPTGPLARVPLEAVLDDFAISYVPSGSVLALLAEKHRAVDGSSLLALGDPAFDRAPAAQPPAYGVLIKSVSPDSHAARAGLKPGDVLLSIGAARLDGLHRPEEALSRLPARATFWRDGETLSTRIQGAPLGAALDQRSAKAAVRASRRDREATAQRGTGHGRLPGTRVEAEAIAALVKDGTLLL